MLAVRKIQSSGGKLSRLSSFKTPANAVTIILCSDRAAMVTFLCISIEYYSGTSNVIAQGKNGV